MSGSSGTIGTRLFEKLLELDYDAVGLDRKNNKWKPFLNERTRSVDLLNREELMGTRLGADLLIHLAANARVYDLIKNPDLALENLITTYNIMEFSRKNKIGRVILASSREAYGTLPDESSVSEDKVRIENCESPYSASKIGCEALVHAWQRVYGIDFVVARFSNVYGMYDDSNRLLPLWIENASKNKDLIIYGDKKVLDFTYIDDCVDGIISIVKRFDEVKGETFNIASGKPTRLTYVATRVKELLSSKSKIVTRENRMGEVWKFCADISKARKLLGYHPGISIDEGLQKTVKWYKENVDIL